MSAPTLRVRRTITMRIAFILMLALTLVNFTIPVATTQAARGPLPKDAYWHSDGGGRSMYTKATLQRSGPLAGQLDATTRTKTVVMLNGFTGGVFIVLLNADGAFIGVTGLRQFGVDGTWIGRSDRTDAWQERFDPQVAAATEDLLIIQQHEPKDLTGQVSNYQRIVCDNLRNLKLPLPPACQ